eukprot:2953588-Pyramimonas_sp.AAC.1
MDSFWRPKRSYGKQVGNARRAQQFLQRRTERLDMVEYGYFAVLGFVHGYNAPVEQGSMVRHSFMGQSGWPGR